MEYDIYETLSEFYKEQKNDFHRFNSWKHCYEYFQKENLEDKEKASLHLGFYLASWGMYRGSTFLLQNDYKIHNGIIDIIEKSKNNDFDDFNNIFDIAKAISDHYLTAHPNSKDKNNTTDTLISKILLGVFACVPAYDRYFILGLNHSRINTKFDKDSFNMINKFYNENEKEFVKFNQNTGYQYPKMKLLDMYFWKVGFKIAGELRKLQIMRKNNEITEEAFQSKKQELLLAPKL
jgi:hypothetical protein